MIGLFRLFLIVLELCYCGNHCWDFFVVVIWYCLLLLCNLIVIGGYDAVF